MKFFRTIILLALLGAFPGCSKPKPPATSVQALAVARHYVIQSKHNFNLYHRQPVVEFNSYSAAHGGPIWKVTFAEAVAPKTKNTPEGEPSFYGVVVWVRPDGTVESADWHNP